MAPAYHRFTIWRILARRRDRQTGAGEWVPLFLLYPGPASLPRIGAALLRADLPSLSVDVIRSMVADAVDIVPRPRRFRHTHRDEMEVAMPVERGAARTPAGSQGPGTEFADDGRD